MTQQDYPIPTTNQITLEEALKLVEFERSPVGWRVKNVRGSVRGSVEGSVWGSVGGSVWGSVRGDVGGSVWGEVLGTIKGRKWCFIETPKERLKRLIEEGADKAQLLEAINQLEESNV